MPYSIANSIVITIAITITINIIAAYINSQLSMYLVPDMRISSLLINNDPTNTSATYQNITYVVYRFLTFILVSYVS